MRAKVVEKEKERKKGKKEKGREREREREKGGKKNESGKNKRKTDDVSSQTEIDFASINFNIGFFPEQEKRL